MNTDIRLNISWLSHPKRRKLERRLGPKGALCFLDLLLEVAQNKPDGNMYGWDAEDIAIASQWPGDSQEFVDVLVEMRLLDVLDSESHYAIHDWKEHNPWVAHSDLRRERAQLAASHKWGRSTEEAKATRSQRMSEAKRKGNHTQSEWEEMKEFFGECVKCQGESGLSHVDRDHIIPIYKGGSHGIDNIQPLCAQCNAAKGPETVDYRLFFCQQRGLEMPAKWLQVAGIQQTLPTENACTDHCPLPSPTPTPTPTPKSKSVLCETDTETTESQLQPEPQHCAATAAPHANNGQFLLTSKKHKLTGWKLEGFEEFWEAFADKRSKAAAAESWRCIPDLSPGLIPLIVEGAFRYARDRPAIVAARGTPKMAQGWLTDRRWEDEKSEHAETDDLVAYLENKYGTEDAAKGMTQ